VDHSVKVRELGSEGAWGRKEKLKKGLKIKQVSADQHSLVFFCDWF
jgi:hypothetical protein